MFRNFIISLIVFLLILPEMSFARKGNSLPSWHYQSISQKGKNISVKFQDASLKETLNKLALQGNLKINFAESILPLDKKISYSANNLPALEILRKILLGTGIKFRILEDNQVVLFRSENPDGSLLIPNFTINGFVSDAENGEALFGANVFFEGDYFGCATNHYGFYSITLPEGIYRIRYSYMGYHSELIEIELSDNIRRNIELKKTTLVSDTVIVVAQLENEIVTTAMGTIDLAPDKIKTIPVLFGEFDLLKTMQLLPGVSAYREGDGGLNVRGGNADQNLLLLDEAPVFNAYHFFGFFSVFNSEAIKNVKLIKGSAPPRYGGKLSSVIDVQMKEGNINKFQGSAGIGLIFSRLNLEGPLFGGRGSYILSGRRTYLDMFKYLSGDDDVMDSRLYFYDFNVKTNYILGENDRIYLSGYLGNDVMGFGDVVDVVWGNKTGTLRWNHLFTEKLFVNTSLIFSNFTHSTTLEEENNDGDFVSVKSMVNDITLKSDFQYFLDRERVIQFGANYIHHTFLPADIDIRSDDIINIEIGKRNAEEYTFYASDEFPLFGNLKINYGLRYTLFSVHGKEDIFDFGDDDPDINVDFHKDEDKIYSGLEPRITSTYIFDDNNSLKLGYARNFQYIHMVSSSNSGTPLDVWQPVSSQVAPMKSDQISMGYFRKVEEIESEFSVELFYKKMSNLVEYRDGANLALRSFFESEYVFGEGSSYGMEFFLKRRLGDLTGWLSYTLSRSERKFPDINNGESFPAKFDRTHDVAIVLIYEPTEKWNFSANWVYATGNAITIPHGKYELQGKTFDAYSPRNNYRMPAYHRLDLSVSYKNDVGGTWIFSLYNAYGQRNPYAIIFRDRNGTKEALRLSLFSFIPSVTYTLSF